MRIAAAFSPGFEKIIPKALAHELGSTPAKLTAKDGLCRFEWGAATGRLARTPILASVWVVFQDYTGAPSFRQMVQTAPQVRLPRDLRAKNFRVRFMRGGKLASVDSNLLIAAERAIAKATGMKSSRTGADCEFWYNVRAEGGGFFGMLLVDREERRPEKGELRPSLAAAIAEFAGVDDGVVAVDPFAGHGSLPAAVMALTSGSRVVCIEREQALANYLRSRFARDEGVRVLDGDARDIPLEDASVDVVLTDPPWGMFKSEPKLDKLYRESLGEMRRILKPDGRAAVLTSRETDFWPLADEAGFREKDRVDTLVGGKKATVHLLIPKK